MKYTKYYSLIFPLLIVLIGFFIYEILEYEPNLYTIITNLGIAFILEYEPNFYTIITNLGIAFILSPRVKTFDAQTGRKEQVTWLFYKKSKIIN